MASAEEDEGMTYPLVSLNEPIGQCSHSSPLENFPLTQSVQAVIPVGMCCPPLQGAHLSEGGTVES
eukprot:239392-Rhodomonas_salina.2